jgi:hypothetical protein
MMRVPGVPITIINHVLRSARQFAGSGAHIGDGDRRSL